MKYRVYLAPLIGTGTKQDPFRSLLNSYIDPSAGDWFTDYSNVFRKFSLVFCFASASAHAAIVSDQEVVAISPLCADTTDLRLWLNTSYADIGQPAEDKINQKLESFSIPADWIGPQHALRDVLRYALRFVTITQIAEGEKDSQLLQFISNNLATTVSQISVSIRNRAQTWMQSHNLDTSWISGTTTVRAIIHFILSGITLPTIKIFGEVF